MSSCRGFSSGSPSGMATNSIAELREGAVCKGQIFYCISSPTQQKLLQSRDDVCTRSICKMLKCVIDQVVQCPIGESTCNRLYEV